MNKGMRLTAPNPQRKVRAGDILVIEAEADALATVLSSLGLKLEEAKHPEETTETKEPGEGEGKGTEKRRTDETVADTDAQEEDDKAESTGEVMLMELAVLPASTLTGRSARDLLLRTRYGLNLLAVSAKATARWGDCARWPFGPATCC